ncbi:MAG: hypothetical protein ABIH20_01010 [Candidatus Diapherotrites archaeon]
MNFDLAFRFVHNYLLQYEKTLGITYGNLGFYVSMLDNLLEETKQVPRNQKQVKKCIENAVRGKRIMEIGCRDGTFLRLLQDHGAIVAGATSGKHYAMAQKNLNDAILVNSNSEEVGSKRELVEFKPDFLFNMNLFDRRRWGDKKPPYRKLYTGLRKLVSPNTRIFLTPAVDSRSVMDPEKLRKSSGVTHFKDSRTYRNGHEKAPHHLSISFRLKRR